MPSDPETLLRRNLALFERMAPGLYPHFKAALDAMPGTPSRPSASHKKLRIQLGVPERTEVDVQTFDFVDRLLTRLRDEGILLFETAREQHSHYLFLMGAPDDQVLAAALDLHTPLCLLVGIGDPALFAESLRTVDWARHMGGVQERGGAVYLLPEATPEAVIDAAWRVSRTHNPTQIDGFVLLATGDDTYRQHVSDLVIQTLMLSTTMLGFFHDETVMQWNTYRNLRSGKARTFRRTANDTAPPGVPAFVVGSGPSLDKDIDAIKARASDAVVISLASSLRPLLKAGITPDFHVELENVYITPKLVELSKTYDLSDLKLVAAASVETAVLDYVDVAVLYARYALSSYPVFSKGIEETLSLPGPTAGNAALCFALESGFDEVYLFGLDLGTWDPEKHHAGSSFYYTDEADPHRVAYDLPVPGNFRECVLTSQPFLSALKNVSDLARNFRTRARIFNCSDGARIQHTTTLASADIRFEGTGKPAALTALEAGFETVEPGAVIWPGADFAVAIRRTARRIRDVATPDAVGNGDFERNLIEVAQMTAGYRDPPPLGLDMAATMLMRGTLLAITLFLNRYRRRVANAEDDPRFARIAAEELVRSIDALEADAVRLLGGERPLAPPPVEARIAAPGRALPIPANLSRNAPCPCGSGRRFKQCHGAAA